MNGIIDGTIEDASNPGTPDSSGSASTIRHYAHRNRRNRPTRDRGDPLENLAHKLEDRHRQRNELLPFCESGNQWTWATWPWPKPPLQKDIDNAKDLFVITLPTHEEAGDYFTKNGTKLTIERMRDYTEALVYFYSALSMSYPAYAAVELSTKILRRDATRVFRALARESNFVGWDVVVGTYEWIDQYLSIKYHLRTDNDEQLDMAIPEINREELLNIIVPGYQRTLYGEEDIVG